MRYAAAVLAAAALYAGLHWGSTTAGGADSYGYVSQAGLWRQGQLAIQQDIVRSSPWPGAGDTWAPLGYRASLRQPGVIVPLYPPGLPILMALVQAIGGFCAAFLIVPVCGALTIWLTFVLGQRLFAPVTALAGAVLVATSPTFLYQLMNPMTDVPVTAAWTLALVAAVTGWPIAAGAASAAAILIRPNLAPVALVFGGWLFLARRGGIRYLAGALPAMLAVAVINARLYESSIASGYGALGELYSAAHLQTNLRQFATWIVETQTPIVFLAAMFFIAPRLFPDPRVPLPRLLLGGTIAVVTLSYLFYQPFDAWWYLRFLLPIWPVIMLLTAASIDAVVRRAPGHVRTGAVLVVAGALAVNGVAVARARSAFDIGRSERRYLDVARFVSSRTEPGAVMIALQHSGTLRMYAGRMTLRFDQLDPAWLDRAVAFLEASGRHSFIVVEAGERRMFQERFAAASEIGRLDWRPFARLDAADVTIYDAVDRRGANEPLAIGAAASRRTGWRCDLPQEWPTPLRTP